MNVEGIKEKYGVGKTQEWDTMPDDVRYLLSIIEQAEKALEDIKHISSPRIDDFAINQIARQALKAIRGN